MLSRGKELSNTLQVPLYKGFNLVNKDGYSVTGTICLTNKGVWLMYAQAYMPTDSFEIDLKSFKKGQLLVERERFDAPPALYKKVPRD